jgi:hypothetical protein
METVIAEASLTANASFLTATSAALTESPTPTLTATPSQTVTPSATSSAVPSEASNNLASGPSPTPTNTNAPGVVNPAPAAPRQLFGIPYWIALYFACGFMLIVLLAILYFYFIVFREQKKE